jgi:PKD repeat protein
MGTADFIGSPRKGTTSLTVHFTDKSLGSIESWLWDFGDGHFSSERNPTYYYSHPGIYTVSLTVSDTGSQDTKTIDSYIQVLGSATYDTALGVQQKAYLWGIGIVNKRDAGIEIKRVTR